MRCPTALARSLACSVAVLIAVPCICQERCLVAPTGPLDLEYLTACRPAPVSAVQRAAILRTLPAEGAVTVLGRKERANLDSLTSVLRLHAREDIYVVTVIDVPQAWVGLHGRAVLLISLPALRLLRPDQLQALVAHEIGHEYFWDAWQPARLGRDRVRLRSLEAVCDAIAALTLTALNIPTDRLSSALVAVHDFNRRRFGIMANDEDYPSVRERQAVVKRFSVAIDGGQD